MDTVEELSQKSGDGITADDLDWPKSRFKPKLPKRRKVVKDPVLKAEQIKIRREEGMSISFGAELISSAHELYIYRFII